MWIVQVALRRPYTFIVLALLLPLIGALWGVEQTWGRLLHITL